MELAKYASVKTINKIKMSKYLAYTPEQLENHLSQFLIDSWSYSKVQTFSRNQKAFEMEYAYGFRSKSSASSVAGNAYHKAVEYYFSMMKNNEELPDLVTLEKIAFDYIEELEPNFWKLQKSTPTISECIIAANKTASSLIQNFLKEINIYVEFIEEVLEVEFYGKNAFVKINGVDIPIPLAFRTDLIVKTTYGKIAVIDHKSKGQYTGEADIKLAVGKQAVTYVIGFETLTGIKVDEVWFIENKYSANRDKSPQLLKYVLEFNEDTKKYYEALLYESLRGMIQAVNDPDYVYIMNDSDNLVDLAEMYEFWNRTLICEVEEFNIEPNKVELIRNRLKKIKDSKIKSINPKVLKQFREQASEFIQYDYSNKNMTQEEKIEQALRSFGCIVKVAHKFDGYSSDSYLLEVGAGVKVSQLHSYRLDLANALNVSNVRISKDLVMHEGKSFVCIDFAKKREKDLLFNKKYLVDQKIPIGIDNFNNVIYWDLNNHSTPHALVCGSTGSGKSVELKSMIEYGKLAGVEEIIVLDPKFEFCRMNLKGVVVISEIEQIESKLKELVEEMNERTISGEDSKKLIFIDEFADAQAQARSGKDLDIYELQEVGVYRQTKSEIEAKLPPQAKMARVKVGTDKSLEENLRILLQKGRSVGFRIVAATQRASSKIINGDAKANFPVLICFRVPKEIDSRVVIDEPGAESLAGSGDGLIKSPEYKDTVRFQAFYKPNK